MWNWWLDDPSRFLPSRLRYRDEELLWTTNVHVTWRNTQVIGKTANSTILKQNVSVTPPQTWISTSSTASPYQREYVQEYKQASAILESWITEHTNDPLAENAIIVWKETCDKLLENAYFAQRWHLPAFCPFYSYQCMVSIDSFFVANQSAYLTMKLSGISNLSLQEWHLQHGSQPMSSSAEPNEPLFQNARGIINTSVSTFVNSPKYGPLSFKTPPSQHGVELWQEIKPHKENECVMTIQHEYPSEEPLKWFFQINGGFPNPS